jgi:hypothetical protein
MATYKVAPPIPKEGLILYLDCFNLRSYPGTGSTWYDISGNKNHFEIQGDITFVDKKGFTNFEGNSGSIGNKIYCLNENFAKALKLGNGGNGYTILTWGNSIGSGVKAKIVGFNDSDNYIDLYQNSSSNAFHAEDGSTVYIDGNTAENNGFILVDTGYHQMGATNSNSGGLNVSQGVLTIGNEPSGSSSGNNAYPWSGSIAVVMMYNRVLPIEEIRKTHNIITQRFSAKASFSSPNPELIVHLDASNTGSYPGFGNIWFDLSGNGNHAYKLGITGTPIPTGSGDTAALYFPALTPGASGSFTIENSQTLQSLNQITVEAIISPESKILSGTDTSMQTIFSKDDGSFVSFYNQFTQVTTFLYGRNLRPGLGFDQNIGLFRSEIPTVTTLDSLGITTMIGNGTIEAQFGLNWDSLGLLNTYADTPIPTFLNHFATKFEGYFKPKETGTYRFTIASDDGSDLFVSGTLVTSHYGGHGLAALGVHTGSINLVSGSYYPFRARQQEYTGGEGLRVFWKKPSQLSGDWTIDIDEISTQTSSIDNFLNYTFYRTHGGNGNTSINPAYPSTPAAFDKLLVTNDVITTPDLLGEDWYYVALTIGASEVNLFANTSSISASLSMAGNNSPIYIGSERFADNFKGKIAVVKFWNRALTNTEISSSYESYKTRFNLNN